MIIISGPSTVGKNPFIYQACKLYDLNFVIPYTTRTIRSDEVDGKDYFFEEEVKKVLLSEVKNMSL